MAKRKIEDLKQYWQEIAAKAGLSEEDAQLVTDSLGKEAVSKAFRQAFVAVPDHHSTLDEVKQEAEARVAQYDTWYNESALPAYKTNVAGIERLRQYETQYGDLTDDGYKGRNYTTGGSNGSLGFKDKEELDKYIEDKLRAQQAGYIGLAKVTPTLMVDYYDRFKKKLDLNEIQKISEKEGVPPDVAYERYIAPMVEEQRQRDLDAKIKEAEDRGAKRALSNHNLPVGDTPRDPSVYWDREEFAPDKAPTELQQDRMSHEAFNSGWSDVEAGTAGKQST